MHVVTVMFEIRKEWVDAFLAEMVSNAQASLEREEGCRQFDVCVNPAAENQVFLYELYDSKSAFDAHLASAHFIRFNEVTAPWVAGKQVVTLQRIHPLRGN